MKKVIYFDNAATTQIYPEALTEYVTVSENFYGNPSGIYSTGVDARRILNKARHDIAGTIGAFDNEIYFTSGGSEGDNLALKGILNLTGQRGRHVITTAIEHKAVLNSAAWLEKQGLRVTYVPVKPDGTVDPDEIEKAICNDTVLISVMLANNETGALQPVKKIGEIAHSHGVLFHTDAVQGYGKVKIDVNDLNVDMLSVSAHKFHGPKGTGFIYVKNGTGLEPLIHGGAQERDLRAGTENVPAIAAMKAAALKAVSEMEAVAGKESAIKKFLYESIIKDVPGIKLNGSFENSLPGILNVSVQGVEGESLLINLDMKGIAISTGSACTLSKNEPSHVIRAMGGTYDDARSSVRFSFSGFNTMEEAERVSEEFKNCVEYLRKMRLM